MLEVRNVSAAYGRIEAVRDVSLAVNQGEIVVMVGRNGAGKTTTLKTICGLLRPAQGHIFYEGKDITGLPSYEIARLGLNLIPEGRQIFADQTVWDNLNLGLNSRRLKGAEIQRKLDYCFNLFPRLKQRTKQLAGTLSGGEQQMLAVSRALMQGPRLLVLDEPSLGLAPIIVTEIMQAIWELRAAENITILLVEQMRYALQIADRAYVLKTGQVVWEGSGADALNSVEVEEAYLGKRKVINDPLSSN